MSGPDPEYHRLMQGTPGAWWRLVVTVVGSAIGLLAGSLLAILLVIVVARLLGYDDFTVDPNDGINAGELFAVNLGLISLIPIAALLARVLYRERPRQLSSVRPGMRWSWLLGCVAIASVVWGLLLLLSIGGILAEGSAKTGAAMVAFILVVVVTTPLQAAGEEYVFRGVLMQAFGAARLPTWVCCLATGLLFATAHLQFAPGLFLDRLLLGVVFAWLVVRTGGLEAPIAIHAVKNVAVLIPAGLLGQADEALDPGAVTWIPFLVDVVLLAIAVPWIVYRWRKRSERERYSTPPTYAATWR